MTNTRKLLGPWVAYKQCDNTRFEEWSRQKKKQCCLYEANFRTEQDQQYGSNNCNGNDAT